MIIWANKNEINIEMINSIGELSDKAGFEIKGGLLERIKAWELSIIFRQIQRHFGKRKDISILDFGAGSSPFGAYLNHIGYQFVTLLDLEKGWLPHVNQENYNKRYDAHVQYFKTDIVSNYVGYHDVIFSASVLEHIKIGRRVDIMRALTRHLSPSGLLIHAADYPRKINFKELIDNCGIPISYKPEETPGCKEFKNPPEYTWWNKRGLSSVAFFNEREE